jgi:hypothetical protein
MPKHNLQPVCENDPTMKRTDAFMLGMTAFVAANCISYFLRSRPTHMTGWGQVPGWPDWFEAIGFPFAILEIGTSIAPIYSWSSINLVANVVVAAVVSYLAARWLADRLPLLWEGYSRTSQYSLRGLLAVVTIVCLLLGFGTRSSAWGLAVRNLTCFGGPAAIYAWYLYHRQISWTWLAVAAIGLTLLAFTVDFRYQDPPISASQFVSAILPQVHPGGDGSPYTVTFFGSLTVMRTVVSVFGLLSLLVFLHVGYDMMRPHRKRCLRYLLDCLRWG